LNRIRASPCLDPNPSRYSRCVAATARYGGSSGFMRKIAGVDTFIQQVVNGLTLGCVYAVVRARATRWSTGSSSSSTSRTAKW
jgi:hypothetical protein